MKVLGIMVSLLGIVGLVLGVLLVFQGGGAKSTAIEDVKSQGSFALKYEGGTLVPQVGNLIDTSEEIDQSAEALQSARWAMGKPLNSQSPYYQTQVNILAQENGLNLARAIIGLGGALQGVGLVNVLFGIALTLSGVVIYRLATAKT